MSMRRSSTATVKRNGTVTGTGVTAQVSSTADGWKAVVDLPLAGLTTASTPKLDVAVTNGATSEAWNTPGSLGSLQLVEDDLLVAGQFSGLRNDRPCARKSSVGERNGEIA